MGLLLMFVLCTGMLFVFYHLCIMLHVAVTCLGSCGSDFQPTVPLNYNFIFTRVYTRGNTINI